MFDAHIEASPVLAELKVNLRESRDGLDDDQRKHVVGQLVRAIARSVSLTGLTLTEIKLAGEGCKAFAETALKRLEVLHMLPYFDVNATLHHHLASGADSNLSLLKFELHGCGDNIAELAAYPDKVERSPPTRVLAADGLHPSFEGGALIASHIQEICFRKGPYTSPEWRDFSVVEKNTIPSLNNKKFPLLSSPRSQTRPPTAAQVAAANGPSSTTTDPTRTLQKNFRDDLPQHKAPAAPTKSKKGPSSPSTYNLRKNAGQGAAKNRDV
ncbi:hypothetical protein HPB49_020146 [Dermacentor silvarum]|uniref:Uncharacterized protein n=1 Tax=Dermacentor silvarum TaxID=543639 RepID=A0ACB8D7P6_DERSI|nr:hypothetical protein HPB49_020146 [Dermacentor silvarum]